MEDKRPAGNPIVELFDRSGSPDEVVNRMSDNLSWWAPYIDALDGGLRMRLQSAAEMQAQRTLLPGAEAQKTSDLIRQDLLRLAALLGDR